MLIIVDNNIPELAIREGKYLEVKRTFAALNYRVIAMHRFRISDIFLDDSLNSNHYRPLITDEMKILDSSVGYL